ncbi:aminotransferase class III-fold pyridoxal phosphate-dependent enzyme [Streptomyces sp. NPDC091271]|uniref:aminotransferase class III-fold pyridoxal phosphate-dependent enzyme n=1 Tax=Streptomyces sp. NPDC091271 TaxID=3365980 RepID=UPI00380FC013
MLRRAVEPAHRIEADDRLRVLLPCLFHGVHVGRRGTGADRLDRLNSVSTSRWTQHRSPVGLRPAGGGSGWGGHAVGRDAPVSRPGVSGLVQSLDAASVDQPLAAVVVETVQGEGGVNQSRPAWLTAFASWTRAHGTLLVVDDIQMGGGRTGPPFSLETSGITPTSSACPRQSAGTGCPWPSL